MNPTIESLEELASSCAGVMAGGADARLPHSFNTAKAINTEVSKAQKTIAFVAQQLK